MAEINAAITQLSSVVQANSATAEETAASSEEMSAQSALLNEIVSRFKLQRAVRETAASSPYTDERAAPAESRAEDVISFSDINDKY
jgi:methyl-accepting chemotaxis protein